MKKMRRVLCAALLLALMVGLCAVSAEAAAGSTQNSDQWNIMLVIDGSGSLDHDTSGESDPNGLRFFAVSNFLETLSDDTANVGAIVFTANYTTDKSDYAMEHYGIKCNTGLLPLSNETRDEIMREIDPDKAFTMTDSEEYIKLYGTKAGNPPQTDIGTALLVAYNTLMAAPQDGRRNAIFLFTDGVTEVLPDLLAKSNANLAAAVKGMQDNKVLMCGIYLNTSSAAGESDLIRTIVTDANKLSPSDGEIMNRYKRIQTPEDCISATDMFLRALGYEIKDESEIITSTVDKTFTVPGVGVRVATIRLYTKGKDPLPDGLKVSFYTPDPQNPVIEGQAANSLFRSWERTSKDAKGNTKPISRVYKLTNPYPGTWTVHVEVPEGNTVEIRYSPSFDVDVGAELETIPDPASIHAGMDVQLNAYLTQGTRLSDPKSYYFYTCRLMVQLGNNPAQSIDMSDSGNGYFTTTLPIKDYGSYKLWAEFTSEGVASFTSPELSLDLSNKPPVITQPDKLKLRYGLFQPRQTDVDLSKYVIDPEDGHNVTYRISGGTCDLDGLQQLVPDGSLMRITNRTIRSGYIDFEITDRGGESTRLTLDVQTRNMTPLFVLIFAALLLLLALLTVLIIRWINFPVDGHCTLVFHVGDSRLSLEPAVPGTGDTKRSTDMLAIANSVLRPDSDSLDGEMLDQAREFVQQHAAELRAIKVKTASGKVKTDFSGKKEKVGMLRVRGKGIDMKLYNRSVQLVDGLFEFGFYPPDENQGGGDYDDYGGYSDNADYNHNDYQDNRDYGDYGDYTPDYKSPYANTYGGAGGNAYGGSGGSYDSGSSNGSSGNGSSYEKVYDDTPTVGREYEKAYDDTPTVGREYEKAYDDTPTVGWDHDRPTYYSDYDNEPTRGKDYRGPAYDGGYEEETYREGQTYGRDGAYNSNYEEEPTYRSDHPGGYGGFDDDKTVGR